MYFGVNEDIILGVYTVHSKSFWKLLPHLMMNIQ